MEEEEGKVGVGGWDGKRKIRRGGEVIHHMDSIRQSFILILACLSMSGTV